MGASRMRHGLAAFVILFTTLAGLPQASAQDKEDPQERLRAALRTATQRVRELEDQNAALQAKQAAADRDRQALADQSAAAAKQVVELRQESDADKARLQQSGSQLAQQQQALQKWQAAYKDAADVAQTRDADAKRLGATLGLARQRIQSCESKNDQLYKIGEEILDLYDKQDVFDLVAAGEPVTKLKRVEIQNAMQDYEDKMRDNQVLRPTQ